MTTPTLDETLAAIAPTRPDLARETQSALDGKTKPRGSLGRLEELACQIAAIRGRVSSEPARKAIVVMGADHGVTEEGVSAYPREVTGQMLLNFARGGAAINVLAGHAGAELVVVDMGIHTPLAAAPGVRSHRMGPGTKNFTREPAMTRDRAIDAIEVGIGIARELAQGGFDAIGIGEMGIGNTTASSALCSVLLGKPVELCTGRGTGVNDAGYARKVDCIRRGIVRLAPNAADPLDVLAKLGGFEIAGLCGVVLGACAERAVVVVDGFIASVAALLATRLSPAASGYLIASHRSAEAGHQLVLEALDQRALLDLGLRLGEGTGAALAMGLVDAALKILGEMATFESAAVSDSGA